MKKGTGNLIKKKKRAILNTRKRMSPEKEQVMQRIEAFRHQARQLSSCSGSKKSALTAAYKLQGDMFLEHQDREWRGKFVKAIEGSGGPHKIKHMLDKRIMQINRELEKLYSTFGKL